MSLETAVVVDCHIVYISLIGTISLGAKEMFKIKEFICKTNVLRIPASQYFPIAYKKRLKNTEQPQPNKNNSEWKVNENAVPKQSVNHCLMLGYSGSKYSEMQYQTTKDVVTVEGVLFKAMLESNWIEYTSYKQRKFIKYQEGSRTDKGVSATRQCCSIILPEGLDIEEVNSKLPSDVRVFSLKRVTEKFNARRYCSARTYTYTLPSISFCHFNDQTSQREYRLPSEKLKLINELLQFYNGPKNFHNFTINKTFFHPSCYRLIKHLECSAPFLVDDVEFCVIRIQGNSFMMHQIRKMMGLMLAVVRDVIDSSIFDLAFTARPINCPTAPGLGPVLDRLHFDEYDRQYGNNGLYEKLTWEECDRSVQQFHENYIRSNILKTEIHSEFMLEWLENLLNYPYLPEINDNCDARQS